MIYVVDVYYDTDINCGDFGCSDFCRCGKIVNVVANPNIVKILKHIYLKYNFTEIQKYIIDRMLRLRKVYDSEKWDVDIYCGYYGEEINRVLYKHAIDFDRVINTIFALSINNQIHEMLKLEYGYVLPYLIDVDFKLKTINTSDIKYSNEEHYKKLNDAEKIYSKEWFELKISSAIVRKQGSKYTIIDGNHRIAAANYHGINKLAVWVVE